MLDQQKTLSDEVLKRQEASFRCFTQMTEELSSVLFENVLHITAISETHLDASMEDTEVAIKGHNIFRHDRNKHGGGEAFYVQDHTPVKITNSLNAPAVEGLWLHCNLPHLKPILVGCCHR